MLKPIYILLIPLFFAACDADVKEQNPVAVSIDSSIMVPPAPAPEPKPEIELTNGLEMFSNIEQIDYCVPLPLSEYTQDTEKEYYKAKFVFKNKKNPKHELLVMGMFRGETKNSVEDYYKSAYNENTEASGKIVEAKGLGQSGNCYYAKGYWSNLGDREKFMEVIWIRPDDIVRFSVVYNVKDSAIWNERLKTILQTDSYCK